MPEIPDNYDAQIIGIADDPAGVNMVMPRYYYFTRDPYELHPLKIDILSDRRMGNILTGQEARVFDAVISRERVLKEKSGLSEEVLQVLLEGRVKLTVLLDTVGGFAMNEQALSLAVDLVRENGGDVSTYATYQISSCGALMWCLGDERFVLDNTSAMWHVGSTAGEEGMPTLHEEKMGVARIFRDVDPEIRDKFLDINYILDPENEDGCVMLVGDELCTMGLADRSFSTLDEMRGHFQANIGCVSPGTNDDPIDEFWNRPKRPDPSDVLREIFQRGK